MKIDENLLNQLNDDNKNLLPQNILEYSINNIFKKRWFMFVLLELSQQSFFI